MKKHSRTKSRQSLSNNSSIIPNISSLNNNFSQKYYNLNKEAKFPTSVQTHHRKTQSKQNIDVNESQSQKKKSVVSRKSTSKSKKRGSSANNKIKINMEIRNVNFFGSDSMAMSNLHAMRVGGNQTAKLGTAGTKLKKVHKKTSSCLLQPARHIAAKTIKANQRDSIDSAPKSHKGRNQTAKRQISTATGTRQHKKAKSQENLKLSPNQWGDLLSHYGTASSTQKKSEKKSHKDLNPISKFSFCNRTGFAAEKKDKVNQDTCLNIENFMMKNRSLFGVFDGHGINGHYVSEFIREILPQNIEYYFIKNNLLHKHNKQLIQSSIRDAFAKTSKDMYREMQNAGIDIMFSGTTAVLTYLHNEHLYCANLGDSRAVMCSRVGQQWSAKPLSYDHKGQDVKERQRIKINGGRVFPYYDQDGQEMGPYRVWLKEKNIPGLAMTRSFGDYVASTVGVISEPEILSFSVQKYGLWEFITNEQAMKLVQPAFVRNDINEAVQVLQASAVEAWKRQDENIDDITIIVIFFKYY